MAWRCLTVWPKWAELILSGVKTLEIRNWEIPPGPLLLHTSAAAHGYAGALPLGALVGYVIAEGGRWPQEGDETLACCPLAHGDVCNVLRAPGRLADDPSLVVPGALGPWKIPGPAELDEALARAAPKERAKVQARFSAVPALLASGAPEWTAEHEHAARSRPRLIPREPVNLAPNQLAIGGTVFTFQ